jgi:hypothetical protein
MWTVSSTQRFSPWEHQVSRLSGSLWSPGRGGDERPRSPLDRRVKGALPIGVVTADFEGLQRDLERACRRGVTLYQDCFPLPTPERSQPLPEGLANPPGGIASISRGHAPGSPLPETMPIRGTFAAGCASAAGGATSRLRARRSPIVESILCAMCKGRKSKCGNKRVHIRGDHSRTPHSL